MKTKHFVNIIVVLISLLNSYSVCLAGTTISVAPQGSLAQLQDYFFQDGNGGFQTVGETFMAPEGHLKLNSFSIWLSDSPVFDPEPLEFNAYLMEWDGLKAKGDFLYESPTTDTFGLAHGERREFIFDDINVSLDTEKQYVFFISVSEFFGGEESMAFPGCNTDNHYLGGHLVTLRNGSDTSAFTGSNWNAANQWDLAFTASFSTPEPATLALLGLGGLVLRKRRKV
jgi:hypothetical protein